MKYVNPFTFELYDRISFIGGGFDWWRIFTDRETEVVNVHSSYSGSFGSIEMFGLENNAVHIALNGHFNYYLSGVTSLTARDNAWTSVAILDNVGVDFETDGSMAEINAGAGNDQIKVTGVRETVSDHYSSDSAYNHIHLGVGDDVLHLFGDIDRSGTDTYQGGLGADTVKVTNESGSGLFEFYADADLDGFETVELAMVDLSSGAYPTIDLLGQTEGFVVLDADGSANTRILLGQGSDTVKLSTSDADADIVGWSDRSAEADVGAAGDTGYDTIENFSSNDKIEFSFFDSGRDNLSGDDTLSAGEDNNRLLFERSTFDGQAELTEGGGKAVSAYTELLIVDAASEGDGVGKTGPVTASIAAALDKAFDLDSLEAGEVIFAVEAETAQHYWLGTYDHQPVDGDGNPDPYVDRINDNNLRLFAYVEGEVNENSFWQAGEEAPQGFSALDITKKTGSVFGFTKNGTVKLDDVNEREDTHSILWDSTSIGSGGPYDEGEVNEFTLSDGDYTDFVVWEKDEYGNINPDGLSDGDFVVDTKDPTVSIVSPTSTSTLFDPGESVPLKWTASDNVGLSSFSEFDIGGLSGASVTSTTGGSFLSMTEGDRSWSITVEDKAGNTETASGGAFKIKNPNRPPNQSSDGTDFYKNDELFLVGDTTPSPRQINSNAFQNFLNFKSAGDLQFASGSAYGDAEANSDFDNQLLDPTPFLLGGALQFALIFEDPDGDRVDVTLTKFNIAALQPFDPSATFDGDPADRPTGFYLADAKNKNSEIGDQTDNIFGGGSGFSGKYQITQSLEDAEAQFDADTNIPDGPYVNDDYTALLVSFNDPTGRTKDGGMLQIELEGTYTDGEETRNFDEFLRFDFGVVEYFNANYTE